MRRILLFVVLMMSLLTTAAMHSRRLEFTRMAPLILKGSDTINIGNLNVAFSAPVYSKPGRGLPFYLNLAYNSSPDSCNCEWKHLVDTSHELGLG